MRHLCFFRNGYCTMYKLSTPAAKETRELRRMSGIFSQSKMPSPRNWNLEALKSVPGIDAKKIEEKKDWIEF